MAVIVVSGARGGIGLEYVRQLSTSSDNTVFALVRDLNADLTLLRDVESRATGKVHIISCDVSSDESVAQLGGSVSSLMDSGVKVDLIINNAAISRSDGESVLALSTQNVLDHVNSNVGGPVRVVQSLLPHLKQDGVIANISSGIGSLGLLSNGSIPIHVPSYSISKAALNMLTIHQACELKGRAIIVCVDPGHVKTEMGGPKAMLEIDYSARQVLSTLASLKSEDSGKYLKYDGSLLPW